MLTLKPLDLPCFWTPSVSRCYFGSHFKLQTQVGHVWNILNSPFSHKRMIHRQSDEVLETGNPNFLNPALKLSTNYTTKKQKEKESEDPKKKKKRESVEAQALLTTTCDQFPIPE